MNKRKRFVLVSVILTLGLLGIQIVGGNWRYGAIILLSVISVGLSAWSLIGDLSGVEWLTTMILPAMYPASVGLFYFLLPENLVSRVILLLAFGVGMYALLLTENIYAVAAIRTIQLVRAAHAIGFLLTIVTSVFFIGTIFSFREPYWVNGLGSGLVIFPLVLAGSWSAVLWPRLGKKLWVRSGLIAISGGVLASISSFLPMNPLVTALLVAGYVYVALGLIQQDLQERLFKRTVQEYVLVGVMVVVAAILVTYFS